MKTLFITLCITLLFFVQSKPLINQIPTSFQAHMIVRSRRERDNYFGNFVINSIKKNEWNISIVGFTNANEHFEYDNGRLYDHSKNICIPPQQVPPFLNFESVIKNARKLKKELTYDKEVNECVMKNNTQLWSVSYVGEDFIICIQRKGTEIEWRIISQNVIILINKFKYDISGIRKSNFINNCKKTELLSYIEREKFKIINTEDLSNNEDLWIKKPIYCSQYWIRDNSQCSKVKLKNEKKDCVFLHGAGETVEREEVNELKSYWGNVNDYTPQCKSRVYVQRNTKIYGWDYVPNQIEYCRVATLGQEKTDKVIKNKIIFAHSMGSLILAAAIKNGHCELDTESSSWYHIAGPFGGTKVVSFLNQLCNGTANGITAEIQRQIANLFGYCVPGERRSYHSYQSCARYYPGIEELRKFAFSRVSGSLCGTDAFGITTKYSVALSAISSFAGFGESNDGFVEMSSCDLIARERGSEFKLTPDSLFYAPTTNHADNTCRNGNGYWSNARKPCDYFINKF